MQLSSGLSAVLPASAGETGRLPILPVYPELIFGLIAIAVLYVIAAKKLMPYLQKAYAARIAAIESGINKAEEAQVQAETALEQYQAQLSEARVETARIREEARVQGAAIVAELQSQARAESARILEAAKKQISAERQQAVVSLRAEVGDLSSELAGRIVRESLKDPARQNDVVDRFLAELEAGTIRPDVIVPNASAARRET